MYMEMVWMLTFGCVGVEAFFAWYIPVMRKVTHRAGNSGRIINLLFSFTLSWTLGEIFQAPSGLIVFMAAILSTIIMMPVYPMLDWCEQHQERIGEIYNQTRQVAYDTGILIYKTLRLITIPIRMARWSHQQYQAVKIAVKSS